MSFAGPHLPTYAFEMARISTTPSFDYRIADANGQTLAWVEAKRRFGTDERWAQAWKDHILRQFPRFHERLLLILPDRIHGWNAPEPEASPSFSIDAASVFAPYFERLGIAPDEIRPMAFDMLVSWWINDLIDDASSQQPSELARQLLPESGAGALILTPGERP